jgi:hypothetical protein
VLLEMALQLVGVDALRGHAAGVEHIGENPVWHVLPKHHKAVAGLRDGLARVRQQRCQDVPQVRIVVDNETGRGHHAPSMP